MSGSKHFTKKNKRQLKNIICFLINTLKHCIAPFIFLQSFFYVTNAATKELGNIPELSIPYTKAVLDNGLTVIVYEDHKLPLVSVTLWYKVGFANENSQHQHGANYALMKLMEKGSEHFPESYLKAMEKAGAININNYATADATVFSETIPTVALERILWLESDRMGYMNRALTSSKLEEVLNDAEQTILLRKTSNYDIIYDRIAEQTFTFGHPYARPLQGIPEHKSELQLATVKNWYQSYYSPNNALLVLAGDIDLKEATKYTQRYFGEIPPGHRLQKLTRITELKNIEKRDSIEGPQKSPAFLKAWDIPAFGEPDAVIVSLIANILGNSNEGRIHKRLVEKMQLAKNVQFFIYERALSSQLVIFIEAKISDDLPIIEQVVQDEVLLLATKGPTKKELQTVKQNYAVTMLKQAENISGKAVILAKGEAYCDNGNYYKSQYDSVKKATAEDIKNLTRVWLSDDSYSLNILPSQISHHHATKIDRQNPVEIKGRPNFDLPKLKTFELNNGLKVQILNEPSSTFTEFALVFNGGISTHNGTPSLPYIALESILSRKNRDKKTLKQAIESLNGQMEIQYEVDAIVLQFSVLTQFFDNALNSISEVIKNSKMTKEQLEKIKESASLTHKKELNNPHKFIQKILPRILYGKDHPYGVSWTGSGTWSDIEKINVDMIKVFWKKWFRPDNATFIVITDLSENKIRSKINKTFSNWSKVNMSIPSLPNVAPTENNEGKIFVANFPNLEQSIIVASTLTITGKDERALSLNIANDITGGRRSSRLRQLFEEEKGWAKSVSSKIIPLKKQRPYIITAIVPTEYTSETISLIFKEHQLITNSEPPTENEISWARSSRIRELPRYYETNHSLLTLLKDIAVRGYNTNYLFEYPSLISQISDNSIIRMIQTNLIPEKFVWIVIGNQDAILDSIKELSMKEIIIVDPSGIIPQIQNTPKSTFTKVNI